MKKFEFVSLTVDARGVAWLTLSRAEKHNAFNEHVISEITDVLSQLKDNKDVRALVLQAEGKSFSAGADLDWMKRMSNYNFEQNVEDANGLANMLHSLYTSPIPTIAKVQGSAFGGGVGLVACCDIVIAAEHAQFCLSEVKLGLIPATISPYVIAAMGERISRRLFVSAEQFSAEQALQWNLVSEVVLAEKLDEVVGGWIERLCRNSPSAIRSAKQLVSDVAGRAIDQDIIALTSRGIAEARVSDEGREGVTAFLDKRLPRWN